MKRLHQILYESYLLLLEYDRDKTIKSHGEKALDAALSRTHEQDSYLSDVHGLYHGHKVNNTEGSNRHKAMHELMSQFEEADPTPNKKYVQHIARMYGNDGFNRHEDVFSRGKAALRDFHDLSTRKILPTEHRDLGKIKNLSQLEDIVDAHKDKTSQRQADIARGDQMKHPDQTSIEDHSTFTKYIPHTKEAAQHWGRGTKWCTATDNLEDSMFDHYNNQAKLHIIVPKQPAHAGEKYQFHSYDEGRNMGAESVDDGQLMDEQDKPAHEKLADNHPEIYEHLDSYLNDVHTATESIAGLHHPEPWAKAATLYHSDSVPMSEREKYLDHPSPAVRFAAHDGLPHDDPRTHEHMKNYADSFTNEDDAADALSDIPLGVHPGSATGMLYSKHEGVRSHGAFNRNLPQDEVDKLADHDDHYMRRAAAFHPKTKTKTLEKLAADPHPGVSERAKEGLSKRQETKPRNSGIIFHTK